MKAFELKRNAAGRLIFRAPNGAEHEGVVPARAFPMSAPQSGLAILGAEGRELAWIDSLDQLDPGARALLEEELARREFLPEIRRLCRVSSFATPSIWQVETDRGATTFVLKGEEDIRSFGNGSLLIADSHGMQFLVRDLGKMDRASRKLLDRFL